MPDGDHPMPTKAQNSNATQDTAQNLVGLGLSAVEKSYCAAR